MTPTSIVDILLPLTRDFKGLVAVYHSQRQKIKVQCYPQSFSADPL